MPQLTTLRIRNLVIIDELTIEFGSGLNLLTGETGAGKSVVVDALVLLAGGRADRSLIRSGAERAIIEGLFERGDGEEIGGGDAEAALDLAEQAQWVVRRELPANGSGRIAVNGSPATLGMLGELARGWIELHGQHEFRSLLSPDHHLTLLDRFGAHDAELRAVVEAHGAVLEARRRRAELRQAAGLRETRLEQLTRLVSDVDAVAPRAGELEALERERRVLRHAAEISELLDQVLRLTYEGDVTAGSLAAGAARRVERLSDVDEGLAPLASRLRGAAVEIQDVATSLREYRDGLDFEPGRLEAIEGRRAAIEHLSLRYGADECGLSTLRDEAVAEIRDLRRLDERLARCEARVSDAERAYRDAARGLSERRLRASRELGPRVERELGALALDQARFDVELVPTGGEQIAGDSGDAVGLSAKGAERARFTLAANPGEPHRPLHKVASGGELSRLMLALHGVVGSAVDGRTLVFDEVDAGVGGAVADAVGARLARLAREQQVLCVTHLPQVAAYADRHFVVRKRVSAGRTRIEIENLAGERRIAELARMLGGRRVTPASRRHATEMLSAAGRGARAPG